MFIKDIKNPFDDNGVSNLRIYTQLKSYEGLWRVYNGAEIRTWKKHHNNTLDLPSPIVEFTGTPPLSVVDRLKKKGVIVKYFPKPNMTFTLDFSKAVIKNQLDTGFQIIGVPDYNESHMEFREKLDQVPKIIKEHPKGDLVSVMPYIRSNLDPKIFEKRLYEILDRDYNMIGYQICGWNMTNIAHAKEIFKKQDIEMWKHASDTRRQYDGTSRASFPNILTYYGIHTSTLRASPSTYFHKMKAEETQHFDSTVLGILQWPEVSPFFGADCSCKYHRHDGQYYTDDARELSERSRIHEMVNGQMELKRAEVTIKGGVFDQYIKNKTCAAMAIFKQNY